MIVLNQETIANGIKTIIESIQQGYTITAIIEPKSYILGSSSLHDFYQEAVNSPAYSVSDALSHLKA